MATLVVAHEVEDYGKWRAAYDAGHSIREQYNLPEAHVYQDISNPNMITVTVEAELSDLQAFAGSQELKDAMADAGVVGPPHISFVNDVT